jgi:hypothetical protein
MEASEALRVAGQKKQPATLVLVVTDAYQPTDLFNMLPHDILLVNSTATELADRFLEKGIRMLTVSQRIDRVVENAG